MEIHNTPKIQYTLLLNRISKIESLINLLYKHEDDTATLNQLDSYCKKIRSTIDNVSSLELKLK